MLSTPPAGALRVLWMMGFQCQLSLKLLLLLHSGTWRHNKKSLLCGRKVQIWQVHFICITVSLLHRMPVFLFPLFNNFSSHKPYNLFFFVVSLTILTAWLCHVTCQDCFFFPPGCGRHDVNLIITFLPFWWGLMETHLVVKCVGLVGCVNPLLN